MALYLTAADVRQLLTIPDALAAAEEGYRLFGQDRRVTSSPSASVLAIGNETATTLVAKGAFARSLELAGVTISYQFGEYYFVLLDARTGMLEGIIERAWMTRLRTAATAGVAAARLARPGTRVAAIIGTGPIAEELVRVLPQALPLEEIRIASRSLAGASAFAARLQPEVRTPLRPMPDPGQAIRGADVSVTMTLAESAFVRPGWLAPGALLLSMGGVPEVEYGVLQEVDRLIVDDLDYALLRGDLACWVQRGEISRADLQARIDADIGEVVAGSKPGRRSADERILAVLQGMVICELVIAQAVLRKARERGVGHALPTTVQTPSPGVPVERARAIAAGLLHAPAATGRGHPFVDPAGAIVSPAASILSNPDPLTGA